MQCNESGWNQYTDATKTISKQNQNESLKSNPKTETKSSTKSTLSLSFSLFICGNFSWLGSVNWNWSKRESEIRVNAKAKWWNSKNLERQSETEDWVKPHCRKEAVVYIPKGKHLMFVKDFNSSKCELGSKKKAENQQTQSVGLYHSHILSLAKCKIARHFKRSGRQQQQHRDTKN